MKCWVQEKLSWQPSKCILVIYGGLSDLNENNTPEETLDNLGALISELKQKNNNMEIYVSLLVPSPKSSVLQGMISDHNEHIAKWGKDNSIHIVNPDSDFRLLTKDIDESCYEDLGDDMTLLNRSGAIRLLKVFTKQLPTFSKCVNWEKVKMNTERNIMNIRHQSLTLPPRNKEKSAKHQEIEANEGWHLVDNRRRRKETEKDLRSPQGAYHHSYRPDLPPQQPPPTSPRCSSSQTHPSSRVTQRSHYSSLPGKGARSPRGAHLPPHTPGGYYDHDTPPHQPHLTALRRESGHPPTPRGHQWVRSNNYYSPRDGEDSAAGRRNNTSSFPHAEGHHQLDSASERFNRYAYNRKKTGCYNCGEFNHHQSRCRFDHVILCTQCNSYGHKNRLCHYYSS